MENKKQSKDKLKQLLDAESLKKADLNYVNKLQHKMYMESITNKEINQLVRAKLSWFSQNSKQKRKEVPEPTSLSKKLRSVSHQDHIKPKVTYNYDNLFFDGLNLDDYVGKGKPLFFDCHPVYYGPDGCEKYTKEQM